MSSYRVDTATILQSRGYEPEADFSCMSAATGVRLEWSHADPQPTPEQLAAWAAEPEYQTWLAEHGGDPEATARRESRELSADLRSPLRPLVVASRLSLAARIRAGELLPEHLSVAADLYPAWSAGVAYAVGDLCSHLGELYEVIQAHTSQSDWTPDVVPALFKHHAPPGVIAAWVQPTGAHDAYAIGARVTHAGKTWENTTAANVFEPGVFGWVEI